MLCSNTIFSKLERIIYEVNESEQTITARGYWNKYPEPPKPFTVCETFEEVLLDAPFNFAPNAARFVSEWYPELIHAAATKCQYFPYDWQTFAVMNREEVLEYLVYLFTVTQDERQTDEEFFDSLVSRYWDECGIIISDVAFNGFLVVGE